MTVYEWREDTRRLMRLRKAVEVERLAGNDARVADYQLKAAQIAQYLGVELLDGEKRAYRERLKPKGTV